MLNTRDMKDSGSMNESVSVREIGGYLELDEYRLPMPHEGAVALNCGRNALAYLIRSKGIRKIRLPYYLCESVTNLCRREGVTIRYYHVGWDFRMAEAVTPEADEWLYIANLYGQIGNDEIRSCAEKYGRVIVDQICGYFTEPVPGVDTIYSCRKWFGVADGAFLYTDRPLEEALPQDESFDRMRFLLGRYERTANEFYGEYKRNNELFAGEPIKRMSRLTWNLLHGIDYAAVEKRRMENFRYLHERLGGMNRLEGLRIASFMYPLYLENGAAVRKRLLEKKIYIPTFWPSVFEITEPEDPEYQMVQNILPLPIDQRYGLEDMEYIACEVEKMERI